MKKLFITILTQLFIFNIFAQNFWTKNVDKSVLFEQQITAYNANYLHLDLNGLENSLSQAPLKVSKNQYSNVHIQMPLPNGNFEEYIVFTAPIMQHSLATKFPEIKTYIFQSTAHLENYGRVDITPKGFHAMLFTNEGTLFIDPRYAENNEEYVVYYKRDFYTDKELPTCLTEIYSNSNLEIMDNSIPEIHEELHNIYKASNGLELKTYRLAVSATAEYTQFHGGNVADGLAAIVTTINRVNGIYEREFSVRLILVDDNDLVVYTDPATDPFQNPNDPSQLLNENRNSLNNVIGELNYDIGHVFGRNGSGLAGFGVVCSNFGFNHKANGTTGISNPTGDPFDVDYVAHEIGHQFGASHTFNGNAGSCADNGSQNSAYEPGSATTIMGYAGICSPQNIQNNSNDYFHNRSLNQVVNFINGNGGTCAVETITGNNIPTLQIVTDLGLTIPKSTPFQLDAVATDIDGDVITYCWEQYDLGPAGAPNSPIGNAPLFRSFPPNLSPTRTFPQINDILNGTQTLGEILPSYTRDMKFKVTARDNVPNAGAFIDKSIDISVNGNSGPFIVTSQNSNVTWQADSNYTVTWDVAGTDQAPVSCNNVNILLSLDGGITFPYTLLNNIPNNGSIIVQAPNVFTNTARIKVECASNIFFNINSSNFEITSNCTSIDASIHMVKNVQNATWCLNSNGELDFEVNSPNLLINSYQWYHNDIAITGATNKKLTLTNVQNVNAGNYFCEISNGCETIFTNVASVSITTAPIIPIIISNNGQLVSSVPYNIQWYIDANPIFGAMDQHFIPTQEGVITVMSLAGACSASSAAYITGIKDLNEIIDIKIVPNPSIGLFTISTPNWYEELEIEIKDVLGRTIVMKNNFQNQIQIDLSNYNNGLYFAIIKSNNYSATYKLKKQ